MSNKVGPPRLLKNYHWERYWAPVVPPTWVVEKAQRTQQPVDWNNTQTYQEEPSDPILTFPMLYRTKATNRLSVGYITHLLPGSCRPVKGWLQKVPE
jgi:hypothetical protein